MAGLIGIFSLVDMLRNQEISPFSLGAVIATCLCALPTIMAGVTSIIGWGAGRAAGVYAIVLLAIVILMALPAILAGQNTGDGGKHLQIMMTVQTAVLGLVGCLLGAILHSRR